MKRLNKHSFDGARPRGRSATRSRYGKKAKHSLFAVSAVAALLGGATLAVVNAVDVTPSAASIPALNATSPETVSSITGAPKPVIRAAMTQGVRLTTTMQKMRGVGTTAIAGFLLAPSSSKDEGNRFLPAEVMQDDADGFHPVLLASLETSMDGERFADANTLQDSPGLSFFDRLTLGEIAVDELAPLAPAETAFAALEVEPEPRPAREDADLTAQKPSGDASGASATTELAYAAPEEEEEEDADPKGFMGGFKKLFVNPMGLPGPGSGIAVYDIRNATVYMPNGQRLEAHSGLGRMKDNPKFTHVRMKGSTPPNIYRLRMREALFHGVEAVRLLPTNHEKMRGRDGILAHTYMLRGTNGSNGCVSFKHYDKFLAAFKRGEVDRMIVIPDMTHLPAYMAQLEDAPKLASAEPSRQSGRVIEFKTR